MEPELFMKAMWQFTEDGIEPHHLSEPQNFSYDSVYGLRVMDYAGPGIQSVLDRYADTTSDIRPVTGRSLSGLSFLFHASVVVG